ncbi:MAG: hypothetical protein K8F59_08015 [Rhodobacteraceae bacterium]|nr:hypothetical protein [Paracoccaceae bacterium]
MIGQENTQLFDRCRCAALFLDGAVKTGLTGDAAFRPKRENAQMSPSDKKSKKPEANYQDGPIPPMQRVLDNPFLLLFLGVTVPTVLYLIWGVMEVASVPIAN